MSTEWIEKARQVDFDRLDTLVGERIAALRLYVENIDKAEGDQVMHDAICRDLVFPCIYTLAQFIESVNVNIGQEKAA